MNMQKENSIQWQPIIGLGLVLVTVLGSTIPLYLQNSNQIQAIQDEMRDFHGRLERQDAEFKGRMEKQDAEFKGKIALQDAEFKAHLMHYHETQTSQPK